MFCTRVAPVPKGHLKGEPLNLFKWSIRAVGLEIVVEWAVGVWAPRAWWQRAQIDAVLEPNVNLCYHIYCAKLGTPRNQIVGTFLAVSVPVKGTAWVRLTSRAWNLVTKATPAFSCDGHVFFFFFLYVHMYVSVCNFSKLVCDLLPRRWFDSFC